METRKLTHPSHLHLAALALGKVRQDRQADLQKHVAGCSSCSDFLSNTPRETFVTLVREAQVRASEQSTPGIRDAGTLIGIPSPKPLRPEADQPAVKQESLLLGAQQKVSAPAPFDDSEIPAELREQTKYRIIRLLGRGGMGSVYEAQHERMDRQVAIKTINPGLVDHPEALNRFDQEVKAAARLDHANVARAYDADEFGSLRVLVMEFVPGQSLDRFLANKERLEIFEACRLVRQAMIGLQHAHERGMVHRDLKPQNLMLTPDGKVKILDFGLAKIASEQRSGKGLTRENALMGTPHYLAPEQALDAAKADIRADIYSLGCTLYCLLSGEPPFNGDTEMKVLLAHQNEKPKPLSEVRPDVPRALSDLVDRMLAKDPQDRPQTPKEAAQALLPFVSEKPIPAAPVRPTVAPAISPKQPAATSPAPVQVNPFGAPLDDEPLLPEADIASKPSIARSAIGPWTGKWKQLPPTARWGGVVALAFLPLIFLAWLAGVFAVSTPHGTIIVENVPSDVDVLVDGNKVTLKRNGDEVTIAAAPLGEHKLELTRDGKTIRSDDVTIEFAGEQVRTTLKALANHGGSSGEEKNTASNPKIRNDENQSNSWLRPDPRSSANESEKKDILRSAEVRAGKWEIKGDELVGSSATDRPYIVFGDPEWSDYNFSYDAKLVEGTGGASAYINDADPNNHFRFTLGWENNRKYAVHWRVNGHVARETRLVSAARDRWVHVEIIVRGGTIVCRADNQEWFNKSDERLPKGRVGFGSWGPGQVRFRNVLVKSEDGTKVLWEGLPKIPEGNLSHASNTSDAQAGSESRGAGAGKFPDAQVFVGNWRTDGDEIVQPDKTELGAMGFGDPDWKDYNFRLKVKAGVLGSGYIGIVFNAKVETDIRIFRMGTLNAKTRGIWRWRGLVQKEVTKDEGSALKRDRWYDVRIEVRGSHCKCFVDDSLVCEDTDDSCSIGKVGLGTMWCDARFKDIKITTPDDETTLWEGLPNIISTPKEAGRVQVSADQDGDDKKPSVSRQYEPPKDARKIDLLKLIDVEKDQVAGEWTKSGGVLTSPAMRDDVITRIEAPFSPAEEYDVRIELVRTEGTEAVGLICLADSKQFMAVVGSWGNAYSGIATLDGKLAKENESGARSPLGWLTNGKRHEFVVKVRRSGVTLFLDGMEISRAAAPYSRFGLDGGGRIHHQDRLGIATCNIFEFHNVELFEITGQGKILREVDAKSAGAPAP